MIQYDNAQMIYRQALELDSNNARLHCNLAYLLWGKNEIDEAMKEYKLDVKDYPAGVYFYETNGVSSTFIVK